jgi:tetratricopeptide (TPR) repeat protein
VALSFAGAQREYVESVARELQARGVRYFYDADEEIGLWGKHLTDALPAIYGEQAAAVVLFVSAEYATRTWTRVERQAAIARTIQERREYVLPARFDDTRLPELPSDLVTVDLRRQTPQQFAVMIASKLASLDIAAPPPATVDLVLEVTGDHVQLTGDGIEVSAGHGGVRAGLAEAVNEARRLRSRLSLPVRIQEETSPAAGEMPLSRAGRLLAESFLPGPVAAGLGRVLATAESAHQSVRIGLAVRPDLAGLPWEAMLSPDGRGPLALHPLVSVYRRAQAAAVRRLPGPIRIVVAIAAPDTGGAVLDYERELRNVLAAVRAARQDAADVRVVAFATVPEIRAELDRSPVHVLHITGHGAPGILNLEDDDGKAQRVTADEFVDQAVPPGRMPLVVTLAACYTDAAGSAGGASFAARLCQRGAAAVIATETSITDTYATRLLAGVYGTLAQASDPDVVGALAFARRQVQADLETSSDRRDNELAGLGEWAAVTVLAAAGSVPILGPGRVETKPRPSRPQIAGLARRGDWYFVGRRREQRRWAVELAGSGLPGIVIHGIGGIGKTTLAAEIAARVRDREPSLVLVSLAGPLTLGGLFGAMVSVIRRELLVRRHDDEALQALEIVGRADLPWRDRLDTLRDHVLNRVPVLVILDNFEDNLRPDGDAGYAVGDAVLAELLTAWAAAPDMGKARLLITCRYRFGLPGEAEQALAFRQLGALSRAETMKLAWSLPALDRLDEGELGQVWRLVGGHPRSLEYLDALLSGGTARYPDVTARLSAAVDRRLSQADRDQLLAADAELDAVLAETATLAADDVLLDDLLGRLAEVPGAAELLVGISVYREPVDRNAVLFQAEQPGSGNQDTSSRAAAYRTVEEILTSDGTTAQRSLDPATLAAHLRAQLAPYLAELDRPPSPPTVRLGDQVTACQAASLLTVSGDGEDLRFFVHRWTASELARRDILATSQSLASAHRVAAAYWRWRIQEWPQDEAADVHDMLEGRYHLLQAGDLESAGQFAALAVHRLHTWGAWDQEASLIHDTLAQLPADSPSRAGWTHQLGVLTQSRGDYDEAARQYQRALNLEEPLGNQTGMAESYLQLGWLAQDRGDYDEAARQYRRALGISEQLGDQAALAAGYHNLGLLAKDRGDYHEATRQYQRSLEIEVRLGRQDGIATSYHGLGELARLRGDYDEAARLHQRSLEISERLGDQADMARSYHALGDLARDCQDYDEASRHCQRALEIFERIGDQASTAILHHSLSVLAQRQQNYSESAQQCQRALEIFERIGDQANTAGAYNSLGALAHLQGDYNEAARQYQRALEIFERIDGQAAMAASYYNLGLLERIRGGSLTAATRWHLKALGIRLRLRDPATGNDMQALVDCRRELGVGPFNSLLVQAVGTTRLATAITSMLDELDSDGGNTSNGASIGQN